MGRLNLKHPTGVYHTYGTKSVGFLRAVEEYGAKLVSSTIKTMGPGKRVEFVNGAEGEYDLVLLNTGYTASSFQGFCYPPSMKDKHDPVLYQILSEASVVRNLYKRVTHPGMKNLFFIGFSRPGFASIPAIAELQARWVAATISGQCAPFPNESSMLKTIAADKMQAEKQFGGAALRVSTLVDYLPYVTDIAGILGVTPPFLRILLTEPKLLWSMFAGPATVAQFRFRGVGAKPELARETIKEVPLQTHRRLHKVGLVLYASAYLLNLVSFAVPMPSLARKSIQPVGFAPLRNTAQLVWHLVNYMHMLGCAYFYANVTGLPLIGLAMLSVVWSLEIRDLVAKKKGEKIVRETVTSYSKAKDMTMKMSKKGMMMKDDSIKMTKGVSAKTPFKYVLISILLAAGAFYSLNKAPALLSMEHSPIEVTMDLSSVAVIEESAETGAVL